MIYKSGKIVKDMGKDGLFVETIFSSIERRFGEYVYS